MAVDICDIHLVSSFLSILISLLLFTCFVCEKNVFHNSFCFRSNTSDMLESYNLKRIPMWRTSSVIYTNRIIDIFYLAHAYLRENKCWLFTGKQMLTSVLSDFMYSYKTMVPVYILLFAWCQYIFIYFLREYNSVVMFTAKGVLRNKRCQQLSQTFSVFGNAYCRFIFTFIHMKYQLWFIECFLFS